jgi:hypothetical protein
MDLSICLEYPDTEISIHAWAAEEMEIDFENEPDRAARCVEAFAAMELKRYLEKAVIGLSCHIVAAPPAKGLFLRLETTDKASRDTAFEIVVHGRQTHIRGAGRAGTLYGAYEILRQQGWVWIAPGADGEMYTGAHDRLDLPQASLSQSPGFPLARGLDMFFPSMDSADFLLWMARNGLNLASCRPLTHALANKLGMQFKNGGHIFEALMDPDRRIEDGRTMWDAHRAWYGCTADGTREKRLALKIQFCTSSAACVDYLSEFVIRRIEADWRAADFLDIWPFDTWGETCNCEDCQTLGNGSDKLLHFVAGLRERINHAVVSGRIARSPRIVVCAYEGTCSIEPPTRPIPDALVEGGDVIVYYPINRCYAHDFFDGACAVNARYASFLRGWLDRSPALPVIMGEYYGVSKFEDLPIAFTERISHDLPQYAAHGLSGITYMHVPLVEWGIRRLRQWLYAALAWAPKANAEERRDRYFAAAYGELAGEMAAAYNGIESAWSDISDWRCWDGRSVLAKFIAWDGKRPQRELNCEATHFSSQADIMARGRKSIDLLGRALDIIDTCRARARQSTAEGRAAAHAGSAVNPAEAARVLQTDGLCRRLAEDWRGVAYGRDVMRLTTELVALHYALTHNDADAARTAWQAAEHAAMDLENRVVPLGYESPGPGVLCKDGLARSQLGPLMQRCRAHVAHKQKKPETG